MRCLAKLRRFNSRSVLEHYGRPIEMLDVDSSRKHYTPQFYFHGFQIDGQRRLIYVHNKRKPEQGIRSRRIENIEVSKDAFSVGADNMLRRQEQMQANILSEFYSVDVDSLNALISDREKSDRIRRWLAQLVVNAALRSRAYRESIEQETRQIYSDYREKIGALLREFLEDHDLVDRVTRRGFHSQEYAAMLESALHLDNYRKWVASHVHPFIRGETGRGIYRKYVDGSWRFYECTEGRSFITADLPSHIPELEMTPRHKESGTFTMPISSRLFLMGRTSEAGSVSLSEEWTAEDTDAQNLAMYERADRFVYSATESEIERLVEVR